MSEEELKNHIEALAVKRMDKPKKLSSECMKHWKEILSRQYNFDRGETSTFPLLSKIIEVAYRFYIAGPLEAKSWANRPLYGSFLATRWIFSRFFANTTVLLRSATSISTAVTYHLMRSHVEITNTFQIWRPRRLVSTKPWHNVRTWKYESTRLKFSWT